MDKNLSDSDLLLSIVIPVYNVELYLARCLDSILKQQVDFEYEVIIVNDCSSDSSYNVILDYQRTYKNIILVNHEVNKKLSVARRSGINLCRGLYVMHVDSDDWLEVNSLMSISRIIKYYYPDVAVFNYYVENSNNKRKLIKSIGTTFFFTNKGEFQEYFLGAPWNKVVRKELLDDLIFGSVGINNGEDLVYSTELFLKAETILLSDFAYYVYFNNLTSLSRGNDSVIFLSNQLVVLDELTKILTRYKVAKTIKNFAINYYLDFILLEVFKYNFKLNKKKRQEVFPFLASIFANTLITEIEKDELHGSMYSKIKCFGKVLKRFGVRKVIGLIVK